MIKKIIISSILVGSFSFFFSCKDAPKPFVCPKPKEDPCMTEALYKQCLEAAKSCSGEVVVATSCPYGGFGCK